MSDAVMPLVTVLPSGTTFEVGAGDTVFHTAVDAGYVWPTVCGGVGSCHMCVMVVVTGDDSFEEADDWESEALEEIGSLGTDGTARLACQARVRRDASVRKSGVRPAKSRSR